MSLSFKDRIAFNYMIATALVIAVVFASVFFIVRATVLNNVDNDLTKEASRHLMEIQVVKGRVQFADEEEWEELEHHEISVNPMFIQVMDTKGNIVDHSPNLNGQKLDFDPSIPTRKHFTVGVNGRNLREVRLPIIRKDKIYGYLIAAVSLGPSLMVIDKLRNVLLISYPIILFGLFFVSRYLAGRSIVPVSTIRDTTDRITRYNLNERIPLPSNQDELHGLSTSINELLQRIEDAMQRERQFTSDASHELRTPLSVLRGTLEVLIRKPRTHEEYEAKVKESLAEIDRLTETMEQLLSLARSEDSLKLSQQINLSDAVQSILVLQAKEAKKKGIQTQFTNELKQEVKVPQENIQLIVGNLVGNAIKYSEPNTTVSISVRTENGRPIFEVKDEGIGIKEEDLKNIFNPFFRSGTMEHRHIAGNGLGLAIAQRAANAMHADITVSSKLGKGSTFTLILNS
ncbi:MAG: HAMP domain-containing protein [Flavobacteriales bacterium]|nr:HAMP domain-containing protein [Flavobacteriales bacterium]